MNLKCSTKDIHLTSRTLNLGLFCVVFTTDVCGHTGLITPYYLKHCGMGVFSYTPTIFSEHVFLKHLCAMASVNYVLTIQDSFKDFILTCNIENEMHTKFNGKNSASNQW